MSLFLSFWSPTFFYEQFECLCYTNFFKYFEQLVYRYVTFYRNGYHGTSPYTQGLTGMGTWKSGFANGFGIHHVNWYLQKYGKLLEVISVVKSITLLIQEIMYTFIASQAPRVVFKRSCVLANSLLVCQSVFAVQGSFLVLS